MALPKILERNAYKITNTAMTNKVAQNAWDMLEILIYTTIW